MDGECGHSSTDQDQAARQDKGLVQTGAEGVVGGMG
jgi:hypothetical protein